MVVKNSLGKPAAWLAERALGQTATAAANKAADALGAAVIDQVDQAWKRASQGGS
jgi:hypothetical protein